MWLEGAIQDGKSFGIVAVRASLGWSTSDAQTLIKCSKAGDSSLTRSFAQPTIGTTPRSSRDPMLNVSYQPGERGTCGGPGPLLSERGGPGPLLGERGGPGPLLGERGGPGPFGERAVGGRGTGCLRGRRLETFAIRYARGLTQSVSKCQAFF